MARNLLPYRITKGETVMHATRGFTLIELMIVVAIVAILSALSISIYADSISKSQVSEAFTITDGLKSDVIDFFGQAGQCPELGHSLGFPGTSASYGGKYVASVDIQPQANGCSLIVTMRGAGSVTPKLINQTITISLDTTKSATAQWSCASTVNPVYLPATCR